jgi:hypothetical protein
MVHSLPTKLILTHLVKKSPVLMEPEASIPCSQKYAIPHYLKSIILSTCTPPVSLRSTLISNSIVLWAVTLCSSEKVWCFCGHITSIFKFKKKATQETSRSNLRAASVGFLLDLLFDVKDRHDMFLWKKQALSQLHGDITWKTVLFIVTTVKTSNPIFLLPFHLYLGLW